MEYKPTPQRFKTHPICLTEYDHDFTNYEFKRRYTIEYKINIGVDETYK